MLAYPNVYFYRISKSIELCIGFLPTYHIKKYEKVRWFAKIPAVNDLKFHTSILKSMLNLYIYAILFY